MTLYRNSLPQLGDALFVTDGGIETVLIFNEGIELPDFAAFDLFRRPGGEAALRRYYAAYVRIAMQFRAGMVLESATWRASADWGRKLGYNAVQLDAVVEDQRGLDAAVGDEQRVAELRQGIAVQGHEISWEAVACCMVVESTP